MTQEIREKSTALRVKIETIMKRLERDADIAKESIADLRFLRDEVDSVLEDFHECKLHIKDSLRADCTVIELARYARKVIDGAPDQEDRDSMMLAFMDEFVNPKPNK